MKIMKTLVLGTVLSLIFSVNASAQKNFSKDADKAFDQKEYFNAIELYKKAYSKAKKKEDKANIIFKTAECYRNIGDTKQQESWYAKAIKAKYADPKAILYLANAKKAMAKYDEALIEYNNYKKEVPSDPAGEDGAKSCELAQKWKDSPTRYKVENMAQFNSKQSDFAPAYADKKSQVLYFTSTREGSTGGKIDAGLGQVYSDIYETKVDKNGKWSTPSPILPPINTEFNEGGSTVNRKMNNLYFTRCGALKNKEAKCQLFIATKQGTSWAKEVSLPFNIDSFAFGHPTISTDEQTLYFASDMPGGYGGKDIWMSTYDKKIKGFGKPKNMGASINTQGDEMYPYVSEDGSLYFASNGLIGMGGLDIFKAVKKGEKWSDVSNMKAPINSAGDDFAIIFEGKKDKGYFTSNREGGKGSDDIYSFMMPPLVFSLEGVVTDCKYHIPVENVTMRLVGSDGTNVEAKTDKAGYYKFAEIGNARYINTNTSYIITTESVGAKSEKIAGYLNSTEKGKITTVGEMESKIYKQDFCLTPAETEIRFPAVLYALNKADLRAESKDSLNFLYQTLIDNPTIIIELSSHTDSRASDAYNDKLSQARAQSCVDYLVKDKGIPLARLKPKGYGEKKLLMTDADILKLKTTEEKEAAHQKNRRTVFRVLSFNYVDPNAPKPPPIVPPKVSGEEGGYEEGSDEGTGSTETPGDVGTTTAAPVNTGTTKPAAVDPKKPK